MSLYIQDLRIFIYHLLMIIILNCLEYHFSLTSEWAHCDLCSVHVHVFDIDIAAQRHASFTISCLSLNIHIVWTPTLYALPSWGSFPVLRWLIELMHFKATKRFGYSDTCKPVSQVIINESFHLLRSATQATCNVIIFYHIIVLWVIISSVPDDDT